MLLNVFVLYFCRMSERVGVLFFGLNIHITDYECISAAACVCMDRMGVVLSFNLTNTT